MTKPASEVSRLVDKDETTEVHDLETHMHLLRRIDAIRKKSATLRTDGLKALFRLTRDADSAKDGDADKIPACVNPLGKGTKDSVAEDAHVEQRNATTTNTEKASSNAVDSASAATTSLGAADSGGHAEVPTTSEILNVSERGEDIQASYKQLRVKWQYSAKKLEDRERIRADIIAIHKTFTIEDVRAVSAYPVLAVAEAMRAFACVGTLAGSNQMIEAWYLIIRELFTAGKPDWIIGGARAGDGGWVTAYSTAQCVQAICDLAEVLERSAELLVSMHRYKEQLVYRRGSSDREAIDEAIPDQWVERDKRRVLSDLRITINTKSHSTLFDMPDPGTETAQLLGYVCARFQKIVGDALLELREAFKRAQSSIEGFRKQEETSAGSDPYMRSLDESRTAHAIANAAINIGVANTREALKVLFKPEISTDSKIHQSCVDDDWMLRVADSLHVSARGVRSGAGTCRGYLSSVIDRQILASEPTDNRSWEPDELSFALSAYILSTDSERVSAELDRLRRGTKLICKDLSSDGTISNRIPYHEVESVQYYTNTEELLGAVSDVVRLTGYPIEEHVASSIYHYFDRQCQRNVQSEVEKKRGTVGGWFSEFDHFREKVDLRTTTDAVESLGAFNRMLDEGINQTILDHFNVRQPSPSGLMLDRLFYPDYGFTQVSNMGPTESPRIQRDSIALTMQKMRAHVLRTDDKKLHLHSLVLHGPGGTGKTTLIEALANTCKVPLVEVTPSDIVERGEADIERRARAVFEALSMLSKVVVLFDEFDPVLKRRNPDGASGTNIYTFLTPGMLPKLKALNESAKERRVAFALMTNLIGSLDVPAVRKGRFDEAVGIYPPDPLSRAGYMARLCMRYVETVGAPGWSLDKFRKEAFVDVVRGTSGVGMTPITAKGWFRPGDDSDLSGAPIGYIFGHPEPAPPKFKFDEAEETFVKKLGEGPFAEREALQWGWLTKWESACPGWDTQIKEEDNWKLWLDYLNDWPTKVSERPGIGSRRRRY